jgi:hypothetical protein
MEFEHTTEALALSAVKALLGADRLALRFISEMPADDLEYSFDLLLERIMEDCGVAGEPFAAMSLAKTVRHDPNLSGTLPFTSHGPTAAVVKAIAASYCRKLLEARYGLGDGYVTVRCWQMTYSTHIRRVTALAAVGISALWWASDDAEDFEALIELGGYEEA